MFPFLLVISFFGNVTILGDMKLSTTSGSIYIPQVLSLYSWASISPPLFKYNVLVLKYWQRVDIHEPK